MPGSVEFIESYFKQTLSSDERAAFELKCTTDEAFAAEVAFYIAARQALREELLMQKVKAWKAESEPVMADDEAPVIAMHKKPGIMRWVTYAAAACLILVASMFLFEARSNPERLAANYIKANYGLSNVMSGGTDSVQSGIEAYKNEDYEKALSYFKDVESRDPNNGDAKKYAGLCYLQQKDYDNALREFDALSAMNLKFNAGNILKASTLLIRDEAGDKEEAKKILETVVEEKQEGYEDAGEWLKKL